MCSRTSRLERSLSTWRVPMWWWQALSSTTTGWRRRCVSPCLKSWSICKTNNFSCCNFAKGLIDCVNRLTMFFLLFLVWEHGTWGPEGPCGLQKVLDRGAISRFWGNQGQKVVNVCHVLAERSTTARSVRWNVRVCGITQWDPCTPATHTQQRGPSHCLIRAGSSPCSLRPKAHNWSI